MWTRLNSINVAQIRCEMERRSTSYKQHSGQATHRDPPALLSNPP